MGTIGRFGPPLVLMAVIFFLSVAAFKVAAEGVAVLAVTTEPAGGVAAPTKAPVVRGFLPVT